jgi:DNA-binding transcriptional LysR family regulator
MSDVLGDLAQQGFGTAWLPDSSFQRGRLRGLVAVGNGDWDVDVSIVAFRAKNNSRRAVSQVWERVLETTKLNV